MKKSLFDRFYKQQKMDKVSLNDVEEQTGSELTSPSPPKRPRTDYSATDDRRRKSKFDFSVLAFMMSPPSALSTPQKSEKLMCAAKRGGCQDENPHEQPQDAKLNVTPVTEATASHCRMAHTDEGFTTAKRLSPALSEDKPSLFPGDDTGGCSAPTSNDKPHHLTGNQPGESLEEETPGDCGLAAGNERDERQVQSRAISCGAQSKEVTRRSDCTQRGNHTNVSSEDSGADQTRDELETFYTSLSDKEGKSPKPLRDHDYTKLCPNPEEETQGKSQHAEKHPQTQFQIPEESVSMCNLETKGQFNETDGRENVLLSAAEYAEESILACDVASDGNTATESVCFEVDDFCGAKGASATGKIIAEAPSEKADHTTETAMPAGISQERAGGDNDASPFGVIDPAIWSETDRETEEKCWNSASAAGGGLSPSVNAHEAEAPRPNVRLSPPDWSGQFNHQSTTRQDEDEDSCQARSIVANKPHNTASSESSSPGSPPASPAGEDGKLESHDTVGHELKEQSASICFPGGLNHPQVEISQCEDDMTAEMKECVESFVTASKSDKHQSSETETHEPDGKFKLVEEEQGNELECLSGLPLTMDVISREKGGRDDMGTDGHEVSETLENSDVTQEDKHTIQAAQWSSPDESTERKKVALCNEDNQERDIKKKLLGFTSCPGSDALVPCQRDFSHPQNDESRNRFSPLTSAFTLNSHVLGGFDTFQKIQLSSSDDDDDDNIVGLDDLACVPVLSSSPHQVLETPQLQLHGGVEREDAGLLCSASSGDELPNFTSAAAVTSVGPPGCELADDSSDHRRHSDSSAVPTGSDAPSSDVNVCPQFDMKPQFDMVLKELQLFFDISRIEFDDTSKPLEGIASEHRDPSSPEVEQHRDTSSDDVDEDRSLEICGDHPTVRRDGEQEVPLGSHLRQETPEDAEGPRREGLEPQQKRKMWSPSFGFEPLLEQLSHRLLEPPRRLGPLKTCTGPRRVGLSKRARTKPLHRPRPYQ